MRIGCEISLTRKRFEQTRTSLRRGFFHLRINTFMVTFLKNYGFALMTLLLLFVVMGILYQDHSYKNESNEHTIVLQLTSEAGISELDAIEQNLELRTRQRVRSEILDDSTKLYRMKIKCPDEDVHNIWNWLQRRKWIKFSKIEE